MADSDHSRAAKSPGRKWHLIFRIFALSFCGLFVLLLIAIQIDNHLLRRRAERLLTDIRTLELRKATFQDAELVYKENLSSSAKELNRDPCSEDHCTFSFSLYSQLLTLILSEDDTQPFTNVGRLYAYTLLGGHPANIQGRVMVRRGRVWGKTFMASLGATPSYQGSRILIGEAETLTRAEFSTGEIPPEEAPLQFSLHPEYLVSERTVHINADTGGPYAPMVWVGFTPYADQSDVDRLTQFDLSCLTRWTACQSVTELMPAASARHAQDEQLLKQVSENYQCSDPAIQQTARQAEHAAVIEVVSNRQNPYSDESGEPSVLSSLRLIERLKGARRWGVGKEREFHLADSTQPSRLFAPFEPGKRYIFLFAEPTLRGFGMATYPCGIVPLDREKLALVRDAIAEDKRANDPY